MVPKKWLTVVPRASPPPSLAQCGFTLIEILAATAIFLGGMTAVLTAQQAAQQVNAMAGHWTTAGMLGSNLIEHLRLLPSTQYAALAGAGIDYAYGLDGTLSQASGAPAFYTLHGQADLTDVQAAHLTVTVSWTEPSSRQMQMMRYDTQAPM